MRCNPLLSDCFPLVPVAGSSDNISEYSLALVGFRFEELSSAFTLSNVGCHLPYLERASDGCDLRLGLFDGSFGEVVADSSNLDRVEYQLSDTALPVLVQPELTAHQVPLPLRAELHGGAHFTLAVSN